MQATGNTAGSAPVQADYESALFDQFCRNIDALGDDVRLLDLGPSTIGNVMHWVRAGHAVSAYDIVAHEPDRELTLDYPDGIFGGVLGWTAMSHMEPAGARRLMREVGRVLRPDGWLFAVFDGDGRSTPSSQRYRIIDSSNLGFEPFEGRESPRPVPTREVESLFQAFREVRCMVMRHGSREALGRRP